MLEPCAMYEQEEWCSGYHVNCPGYSRCKFYKSKTQAIDENYKRLKRLWSLPKEKRLCIADKYNIKELKGEKYE